MDGHFLYFSVVDDDECEVYDQLMDESYTSDIYEGLNGCNKDELLAGKFGKIHQTNELLSDFEDFEDCLETFQCNHRI